MNLTYIINSKTASLLRHFTIYRRLSDITLNFKVIALNFKAL